MIISTKKFQEEVNKAREQAFNEAMRRRDEDDRFRYLHERIDRLERMVYELQVDKKCVQDGEITAKGTT